MNGPYRLVNELHAHDGPVRTLSQGHMHEVISGCQSNSPNIRRWALSQLPDNSVSLEEVGTPQFHSHWVTSSAYLEPTKLPCFPQGAFISGCMDSMIRIFNYSSGELLMTLSGHSKGVVSFSWTNDNKLISGSWDGTAKIFDLEAGGICLFTLSPHENGVHVLGLSNGMVVTTSTGESVNDKPANFQIRFWDSKTGKQISKPIRDHDGPIRSISSISSIEGFVTASNDGTICPRTMDGSILGCLTHPLQDDGMPPFVLDCVNLKTESGMDFVSCGEDGSVVVWESLEMAQSIPHPCCVWCVLALSGPGIEGDFLTGGNDGVIRYFSKRPERAFLPIAEQLSLQFIAEVEEARLKKQRGPSSEDLAKATKWEQRGSHRGKSEGQVMLFNKDGNLIAAQWSSASGFWIEVGEVTGRGDSGIVNGVEYDHVMPVEMETQGGLLTLQLGFNNGENPYFAAQRFISENQLQQNYLKQIAEWITSKAGRSAPTLDMSGASGSTAGAASSSSSSSRSVQAKPVFSHAVKTYTVFDEIPAGFRAKVVGKIEEFSAALGDTTVTPADITTLDSLIEVLLGTSHYHSSQVTIVQINAILKMLSSWKDDAKLFPAFDILRLVTLHPSGVEVLSTSICLPTAISTAFSIFARANGNNAPAATTLTALRFINNLFRQMPLRKYILSRSNSLLTQTFESLNVGGLVFNKNKSIRQAMSSIILNFAVAVLDPMNANTNNGSSSATDVDVTEDLYSAFIDLSRNILINSQDDGIDILYRVVAAVGMIVTTNVKVKVIAFGKGFPNTIDSIVQSGRSDFDNNNEIKSCFKEVRAMFS